jgi:hypothetical protein
MNTRTWHDPGYEKYPDSSSSMKLAGRSVVFIPRSVFYNVIEILAMLNLQEQTPINTTINERP